MTVGDQRGLNVPSLIAAIEQHYRTNEGKRVRVRRGSIEVGLPSSYLYIKDAE